MHSLVLCLLQQRVDPAMVSLHRAQRVQMAQHATHHPYKEHNDRTLTHERTNTHASLSNWLLTWHSSYCFEEYAAA